MLAQFDGTPMLLVGMGDGSLLYYQISEHCMCMVHAQYNRYSYGSTVYGYIGRYSINYSSTEM